MNVSIREIAMPEWNSKLQPSGERSIRYLPIRQEKLKKTGYSLFVLKISLLICTVRVFFRVVVKKYKRS